MRMCGRCANGGSVTAAAAAAANLEQLKQPTNGPITFIVGLLWSQRRLSVCGVGIGSGIGMESDTIV